MLIGIVKKNAIMMIDFALEAQRKHGMTPAEAIYEACLVRFRPIMMTTMAALMGTLPIALGFGAGAEARRPLGLAVVGGLVVSQLLTLYITPVFYIYMEKLRKGPARRVARSGRRRITDEIVRNNREAPGVYSSVYRQLIRHFFGRFFDTESLSPQGDPQAGVIQTLGILAVPSAFFVLLFRPLTLWGWDLCMVRYLFVLYLDGGDGLRHGLRMGRPVPRRARPPDSHPDADPPPHAAARQSRSRSAFSSRCSWPTSTSSACSSGRVSTAAAIPSRF